MNAIIAAATGYTENDLQLFLESVKRSCKRTKVFLIVFRQEREKISNLQGQYPFIEPVYISRRYIKQKLLRFHVWVAHLLSRTSYSNVHPFLEVIGCYPLNIVVERFFIALQIMKAYGDSLSNVMLSDCRDVILQKNPFDLIDGGLVSGLEPKKIEDEPYTCKWIADIYGKDTLTHFYHQQIVCAGVTLGPVKEVEQYLTKMCSEIWKHLPKVTDLKWGSDQGIHNYLIYKKEVACTLTDNQAGLIATLSLENSSKLVQDSVSGLVQVDGKYPTIVHQYDRHPGLVDFYKEQFC